ncbi:MAG: hypothetical protein GY874_12995 [Desulfobacteraceae bacterium]|nr:hypothetical protein [Desulfobacteraceae bacterium]
MLKNYILRKIPLVNIHSTVFFSFVFLFALCFSVKAKECDPCDPSFEPEFDWIRPESVKTSDTTLYPDNLNSFPGVEHFNVFVPEKPCYNSDCSSDEGTYNHHVKHVIYKDNIILYWTNHGSDENGPGQRILASVGRFTNGYQSIQWQPVVELAPSPIQMKERKETFDRCTDAEYIDGLRVSGHLRVVSDRLYFVGAFSSNYGFTAEPSKRGLSMPEDLEEQWIKEDYWYDSNQSCKNEQDKPCWDIFMDLGGKFYQRWGINDNGTLESQSEKFQDSEETLPSNIMFHEGCEVDLIPIDNSEYKFVPLPEEGSQIREDINNIISGKYQVFFRVIRGVSGEAHLACGDMYPALKHPSYFIRPDGYKIVLKENAGGYYSVAHLYKYALDYYKYTLDFGYNAYEEQAKRYLPGWESRLIGYGWSIAGELPDGRIWIIGNGDSDRRGMYITVSDEGRYFDKTWMLRSVDALKGGEKYWKPGYCDLDQDGHYHYDQPPHLTGAVRYDQNVDFMQGQYCFTYGLYKGEFGGPAYFTAEIINDTMWIAYSVSKQNIGITRIPLNEALYDPDRIMTNLNIIQSIF